MPSPRIRRLISDSELLQRRFRDWSLIQITGTAGLPPEVYRFAYQIKGLYVGASGDILERDAHVLEVNLPLTYPRRPPQCRMLTPVFHPNFDASTICIGDFWAASEGLDELIIRIGRMIAYQEYNTKSPLNGLAAKWAALNQPLLPVDSRSIAPPGEGFPGITTEGLTPAAPESIAAEAANPGDTATSAPPDRVVEDPWSSKIVIQ